MKHTLTATVLLAGLSAASSQAAIYTFAGFTRTAGEASNNIESFDFDPAEGWTGSPPNKITGEESMYLTMTVSWQAASNIGSFSARMNLNDNGGAGRMAIGTDGSGFGLLTGNVNSDRDGSGPGTAKPTVVAYDKNANTSVTLVMKVDQEQAVIAPLDYGDQWTHPVNGNPDKDRWYGDTADQTQAAGFMWINPDLNATEASQPTTWAAWRSSNNSYQGVSFITNTDSVDLVFSDIAIYTGDDTPFAVPEPGSLALLGLGGLLIARRRRG